ncbi:hypothetical protein FKP32DRAFT_1055059 [Trametes sanguinea]|nr:hypothetical protein FKP32DRAFT_1055059 [Trametes sanguinea]
MLAMRHSVRDRCLLVSLPTRDRPCSAPTRTRSRPLLANANSDATPRLAARLASLLQLLLRRVSPELRESAHAAAYTLPAAVRRPTRPRLRSFAALLWGGAAYAHDRVSYDFVDLQAAGACALRGFIQRYLACPPACPAQGSDHWIAIHRSTVSICFGKSPSQRAHARLYSNAHSYSTAADCARDAYGTHTPNAPSSRRCPSHMHHLHLRQRRASEPSTAVSAH